VDAAAGVVHRIERPRALGPYLDALLASVNVSEGVARDPIRFPKRYTNPVDTEVAAAFAACLAFGRVELFGPVIEAVLAEADRGGGPAAFADALVGEPDPPALAPLYYRWLRGSDLTACLRTFGRARREHGSLGALFLPGPARESLGGAITRLRALLPLDASRALRSLFAHPTDGSACKRWSMLMRWAVRTGAPDLGLWPHLSPAQLVIPVDTHVFRVAGFLGLTTRPTPGWAAAEEITAALRLLDPADPVKYDFALAHLGISGACRGVRDATVCAACPLDAVCGAPGS